MVSNNKNTFSLRKRLMSFVYAFKGIGYSISSQHNFWIHLFAVAIVSFAGFYYQISSLEWSVIVICFGGVLAAEAFNTAIELLVDFISPEHNKKAGLIKDVAAGAVLLFALGTVICGSIIFIPKIID